MNVGVGVGRLNVVVVFAPDPPHPVPVPYAEPRTVRVTVQIGRDAVVDKENVGPAGPNVVSVGREVLGTGTTPEDTAPVSEVDNGIGACPDTVMMAENELVIEVIENVEIDTGPGPRVDAGGVS